MTRKNSATPIKDSKIKFWSLTKTGPVNECWIYSGDINEHGYGRVHVIDKKMYAHRFSYMIHHDLTRDEMEGFVLRHTCDNPPCVNPNHLIPGTRGDNNRDSVERNRKPVGEAAHKSKLTTDQVLNIRQLHTSHSLNQRELAEAFGVSIGTINDLLLRRTWKHLP